MYYSEKLMERIISSQSSNFTFCSADNENIISFPQEKPLVTYSVTGEDSQYLLGSEGELYSEFLNITVRTNELSGENFCRQMCRELCMEITLCDTERMITSMSAGKCEYDQDLSVYSIDITLIFRQIRRITS